MAHDCVDVIGSNNTWAGAVTEAETVIRVSFRGEELAG